MEARRAARVQPGHTAHGRAVDRLAIHILVFLEKSLAKTVADWFLIISQMMEGSTFLI
jgi:hypothetical protein